jgi:uncharacterized membrane protein
MPTATGFAWSFPWSQVVGGFNSFIVMLNTPVAMAVALILVFVVAGFVVSVVKRVRDDREEELAHVWSPDEEDTLAYYVGRHYYEDGGVARDDFVDNFASEDSEYWVW